MPDTDIRFVIVAFDGLRPDMVRQDIAPNLCRFLRDGVHFSDCRSVFPTETRVNQASLVTGCHPERHGIVANKFVDTGFGGYLNTTDFDQLTAANKALDGALLTVPSLGELLHDAGRSLAVVGCGTPGGNRLLHNHAEGYDDLNISLHGIDKSAAPAAAGDLIDKFGPVPAASIPNRERIDWVVDSYMRIVAPGRDPAVSILWFSDPDTPYHYRGIESPEALLGIAHADAAFGRLLDWRDRSGRKESLQVIAMSDHGHVASHGAPLSVGDRLRAAGFSIGRDLSDAGDAVLVPGTTFSLYTRDPAIQSAMAEWLQGQPWCGPVFARAMENGALPEGTLNLTACRLNHPRAGDLVAILARDSRPHQGGVQGRCLHDNPDIPEGCGVHGGLSPYEVSSFLAASGSRFADRRAVAHPAGLIDVMPTIAAILGISIDHDIDGRVLHEALAGSDTPSKPTVATEVVAQDSNGFHQRLCLDRVEDTHYLRFGERVAMPAVDRLTGPASA